MSLPKWVTEKEDLCLMVPGLPWEQKEATGAPSPLEVTNKRKRSVNPGWVGCDVCFLTISYLIHVQCKVHLMLRDYPMFLQYTNWTHLRWRGVAWRDQGSEQPWPPSGCWLNSLHRNQCLCYSGLKPVGRRKNMSPELCCVYVHTISLVQVACKLCVLKTTLLAISTVQQVQWGC